MNAGTEDAGKIVQTGICKTYLKRCSGIAPQKAVNRNCLRVAFENQVARNNFFALNKDRIVGLEVPVIVAQANIAGFKPQQRFSL